MKNNKKGKVLIFSAPSGAGKTTICHYLLGLNLKLEFSVSACSRKKRDGEVNGKDYHFLSVDEFKTKIAADDFIEWQEVYNYSFYGTLKSEVERIWNSGNHVLFDVDVHGGINLKKKFGENSLSVFIMPPSIEELEKRLYARSTDSVDAIEKRIAKAKEEISFAHNFDVIIENNNLEKAFAETYNCVKKFLESE